MSYEKMKPSKDDRKKFDLCLAEAEKYESSIASILTSSDGYNVEIKTEIDKWKRTGRIALEYRSRGKLSGISTTEADWWCIVFSYKDKIEKVIVLPTDYLKSRAKELLKQGKAKKSRGGDNNTSELVLIPIRFL